MPRRPQCARSTKGPPQLPGDFRASPIGQPSCRGIGSDGGSDRSSAQCKNCNPRLGWFRWGRGLCGEPLGVRAALYVFALRGFAIDVPDFALLHQIISRPRERSDSQDISSTVRGALGSQLAQSSSRLGRRSTYMITSTPSAMRNVRSVSSDMASWVRIAGGTMTARVLPIRRSRNAPGGFILDLFFCCRDMLASAPDVFQKHFYCQAIVHAQDNQCNAPERPFGWPPHAKAFQWMVVTECINGHKAAFIDWA